MFGRNNTKLLYDKLLNKTLSLAAYVQIGDSEVERIAHRKYDPTTEESINTFKYGRGNMSDGITYDFPDRFGEYYNVLVNIALTPDHYGEISKPSTRFAANKDAVIVYINGVKVPDSRMYLFLTGSNTNIIIPKEYFIKDEINDIIIEKRRFREWNYGGTRKSGFSGTTITFPVSRDIVVNRLTALVFVNGLFVGEKVESATAIDGEATIRLSESLTGEVEVFIDSTIVFKRRSTVQGQNIPLIVDGGAIDVLNGPITNDNCIYFINGKRVSNVYVTQQARLHFTYDAGEPLVDANVVVIYADRGKIKDDRFDLYAEDYYMYNFIGSEGVTEVLQGPDHRSNTIFDDPEFSLDYADLLFRDYDYESVVALLKDLKALPDNETRIYKLLTERPELVKDFLEEFVPVEIKQTITWNGTGIGISIGSNRVYDNGNKLLRIIMVNGKVAKMHMVLVSDTVEYWKTIVPVELFNVGDNDVQILESVYPSTGDSYRELGVERYESLLGDISYRAETTLFGNITNKSDMRVLGLVKKEYDTEGRYLGDDEFGFEIINIQPIVTSTKIYIDFGEVDPRIDHLLVTTIRHHDLRNFTVADDFGYGSSFHKVSIGSVRHYHDQAYHDVPVPLLHEGTLFLVDTANHSRLFDNVDFLYRSQLTYPELRSSGFIFRRPIDLGTRVEVALTPETSQNDLHRSIDIEDTGVNKYGLLFLKSMGIPFSKKYMRITANNKIVKDEDVDILTDKFIRLSYEETSIQNLYIELMFNVNLNVLEKAIRLYQNSILDDVIAKYFTCYDYGANQLGLQVSKEEADTKYEQFHIGVDSNGKEPNPLRTENYIKYKYDIYTEAYLRWFTSTRCDHVWDGSEDIPMDILEELELYREGSSLDLRRDITIYSDEPTLTRDIPITSDGYSGELSGEAMKVYLSAFVDSGISPVDGEDHYAQTPNANIVYPHDLVAVDPEVTFQGENIIIGRDETYEIG